MKEFRIMSFFIIVLFSLSTARDTITPTQPLGDNETLISAGGTFVLGFFTPPKSENRYIGIWYGNITNQTIVWVANRSNPVVSSAGVLSVTSNVMMTITDGSSTVVWSAGNTTSGLTDPIAQLMDDGNFVLKQNGYNNSYDYAWQGFDYPTDTLLPGMKLGLDRTSGLNRALVAWKSNNDPSPGKYRAAIDIVSNPEIVLFAGSVKVWRSGTWEQSGVEGSQFSGISNVLAYYSDNFINNYEEVTYSYQISRIVLMVKVLQSGKIQWLLWLSDLGQWITDLEVPGNQCDNIQECGPFAICDIKYPICSCLQGFMPKNLTNWNSENYTEGCIRKTALNCMKHDFQLAIDDFEVINRLKLPESSVSSGFSTFSLDTCKDACLDNCSCTAFAISEGGGGCVIWVTALLDMVKLLGYSDPNLYLRLAAAEFDSQSQHEKRKLKTVAILVSLLSGALLVSCVGCFLWKRNKWRSGAKKKFSKQSKKGDREKDLDLPLYDFGTIATATDQFSDRNKLGQGGFGPVYKGKLGEDQEIAVKRLAKTSLQGTEEFKNEVMLIAKLQNRNLVQLLGCCIEGEERILIYEYMPNKSLDAFLFVKEKSALLDWRTRYQIIVGITRGLFYLHHDSRFRIIHRDLKASNILLDVKMNPKISDFGMARLFGGDQTYSNTRKVVGTYGYMSPEYAMQGTFSLKSDVFSFGVLLLEIISGKKNRGIYAISSHLNLVAHAWSLWNEGNILELVDESMSNTFPRNDVLKCIKIGLLCVQEHPNDRPLMSSVIEMLSADITSLPQPKQPGFTGRIGPVEFEQLENRQSSCTSNGLTSTLDGR